MPNTKSFLESITSLSGPREWLEAQLKNKSLPIYSSYDFRYSGFKAAPVDANIYPAGFNNLEPNDLEAASAILKTYLASNYGPLKNVALLTEEHTNNPFYWRNVHALQNLFELAQVSLTVAMPRLQDKRIFDTGIGTSVEVFPLQCLAGRFKVKDFEPDLTISNNDFSYNYPEWGTVQSRLNPAFEFGWHSRKKSLYFQHYNSAALEFTKQFKLDPWLFTVETQRFENFGADDTDSRERLAGIVAKMLDRIKTAYAQRGIAAEPSVFLKNNSGTYGLGILSISSADAVRSLNNKSRTKMKAAKGGRDVIELIVQEGIPTSVRHGQSVAEPVYYYIGSQLVGRFLRAHTERNNHESLNSPGAAYVATPKTGTALITAQESDLYAIIGLLALTALHRETAEMKKPSLIHGLCA